MAKKHWIYLKRGLSEDSKHRERIGEAIWVFIHILDRADWETGIVYDWRDADEAADMNLNQRTLRSWRDKLVDAGYITCQRRQHCLDIVIHNWISPRDYGGAKMNVRQSDIDMSLSENEIDIQIDTQIDTQIDEIQAQPCQSSYNQSQRSMIRKSNSVADNKQPIQKKEKPVPTELLASTPGELALMAALKHEAAIRYGGEPRGFKQFKTMAIKQKFDAAEARLTPEQLEAAIKRALEKEITGVVAAVDFIAKWGTNGNIAKKGYQPELIKFHVQSTPVSEPEGWHQ